MRVLEDRPIPYKFCQDLGLKICIQRRKKKITFERMRKYLGLSYNRYIGIEAGRKINLSDLFKIAFILDNPDISQPDDIISLLMRK